MQFHHGQWNALHIASAEEQLNKVMWLLAQEGIEVNAPDKVCQLTASASLFVNCCAYVWILTCVDNLPTDTNNCILINNMQHNFTALELAMARNSQARVAQALLKAGADVDNVNARSLRPLFKELIEASPL